MSAIIPTSTDRAHRLRVALASAWAQDDLGERFDQEVVDGTSTGPVAVQVLDADPPPHPAGDDRTGRGVRRESSESRGNDRKMAASAAVRAIAEHPLKPLSQPGLLRLAGRTITGSRR